MDYKLEPWAHQKNALDKMRPHNGYALFHDMGGGKTKTAIENYRERCTVAKKFLPMLIICPTAVLQNWKREILAHSHIEEINIQILDGMEPTNFKEKRLKNPSKKRALAQLENDLKQIFIINTEKVGNENYWLPLYKKNIEFIIVDESHRFKDGTSKRFKSLKKFLDTCKPTYRLALTGSPVLNSQLDIWSQFYIINPEIFGANFFSFRAEYFYDANASMPTNIHFPNWKVKDKKYYKAIGRDLSEADTIALLNDRIYQYADRVMKKDVLDLPPIVYQTLEVPLTKDQNKIYSTMRDEAIAFLEEQDIDFSNIEKALNQDFEELDNVMAADTALVKLIRLQQVIAGVFTSDNGERSYITNNRYSVLQDLLEEILVNPDNKIIIWTVFADTYRYIGALLTKLKVSFTYLTGLQNSTEKQDNMDLFNTDPDCRVIIANQGAGGTGCNLTAANYSIYFTRSFKLEHDLQSEARNYRGGQNRSVTRIDLVTPDTVDEDILKALADKKKMADDVLEVKKEFSSKDILRLLKKK